MRTMRVAGLAIATACLAGCMLMHRQPPLTQAQLNAIETREVDADFDETFKAATGALFDAGYTSHGA